MSIGIKHKRQYFSGTISQQIILSSWSFYETTNKKLAEQIGVSVRTIYNLKSGKNPSRNTKNIMKKFLIKADKDSPKIAVLMEHYKRTKKTKKINIKQVNALLKKKANKIRQLQQKIKEDSQNLLYKNLFY